MLNVTLDSGNVLMSLDRDGAHMDEIFLHFELYGAFRGTTSQNKLLCFGGRLTVSRYPAQRLTSLGPFSENLGASVLSNAQQLPT